MHMFGESKYFHMCVHRWISPMEKSIVLVSVWISPFEKSKLVQKVLISPLGKYVCKKNQKCYLELVPKG